jgi:hypothetical protein
MSLLLSVIVLRVAILDFITDLAHPTDKCEQKRRNLSGEPEEDQRDENKEGTNINKLDFCLNKNRVEIWGTKASRVHRQTSLSVPHLT